MLSVLDLQIESTRFDLEKFNGQNDFYWWSFKTCLILIQQELDSALHNNKDPKAEKEKGEGFSSSSGDMNSINNKAHNTITLHLSKEMSRKVANEKSISELCRKLEELFFKKSLAKRLYLKRKLYTFSIKRNDSNDGSFR